MWVNELLSYWLRAPWAIALVMAICVHMTIYFAGAGLGSYFTSNLWPRLHLGQTIDTHPPRPKQVMGEIRNGIVACLIFGVISLSYRALCAGLWPASGLVGLLQAAAFVVFNNVYSYATHRMLHSRRLIRIHRVHHHSVRVTPWSGYSVHPVEAVIIGATLPLFMLVVPLGIGTAFLLHALGMLFTTCIHCNYDLMPNRPDGNWIKRLVDDPGYHRLHHTRGNVNYGFTSRAMDRLFRTIG